MVLNPFSYGHELLPAEFRGRRSDVSDLRDKLVRFSGSRFYLAQPRRIGKSWFVQKVGMELQERRKIPVLYVDLYHDAGSAEDLCVGLASGILDAAFGRKASRQKALAAREWFGRLDPVIEAAGRMIAQSPGSVFGKETFWTIVDALEPAASLTPEKHVVLAIDEFQDLPAVLKANDKESVEDLWKRMRARLQKMKQVSVIFSGCRRSTLRDIIEPPHSPFHRSSFQALNLSPIESGEWQTYLRDRFRDLGKTLPVDFVEKILETTEGDPTYTKMICHQLAFCRSNKITAVDLAEAIRNAHKTESGLAMARTIGCVRGDDRRVLRFLAGVTGSVKMYENETLKRLGLSSTEMSRILTKLVDEGLVDRTDNHFYMLRDKLYRDWVLYQKEYGRGGAFGH